ncbi:MAG: winged helix-turn-helix transcriptional regulator, partial [Betaproteobacteria bacterium]
TAAAILRMLGEQPEMSIAELAKRLGKVPSTIERAIRKLRESGRLQRIGPDKGGRWQVIE